MELYLRMHLEEIYNQFLILRFDSEVIYDYVDGMHDIENKKLRLIKKPSLSFQEDPVRMLRAIRFQEKLGLKMTNNCRETIREMAHLIKMFLLIDFLMKS